MRGEPFSSRNQRSENEVSQRKDDIEIVEVSLMVHMVMGIEPAEPHRLLKPAPLGHMHAEMEILVEEVIEAEGRHPSKENMNIEKILNPKHHRRMQTENQRRIPPGESDFLEVLSLREKIGWASTKDAVVDQGVRAKWIRP